MKNIIPSLCLFFAFLGLQAQELSSKVLENNANTGDIYIFVADARIQEYDLTKDSPSAQFKIAQRGNKCRVIATRDNKYILKFGSFPYNDGPSARGDGGGEMPNKEYLCNTDNNSYFVIDALDFHKVAIFYPKVRSYTFGALLIPIKLRPGSNDQFFDFSTDVSVGTSIGARFGISNYQPQYIDFLLSVGISSVTADAQTTNNFIVGNTNLAAFTLSGGILLDFSDIQAGVFVGADWLAKEAGQNWIYQAKPWFSIGIGYQIFSKKIAMGKGSVENK